MKREQVRKAQSSKTNFRYQGRIEDTRKVEGNPTITKKPDIRGIPL